MSDFLEKITVEFAINRIEKELGDKAKDDVTMLALMVIKKFTEKHFKLLDELEETLKDAIEGVTND